jgi:hypothetical protein
VGKLAASEGQPMAYRTFAKIWTQLKTHPGPLHVPSTPSKKCDWRAAPSIQRYLFSLKPDLPLASSPGACSGNAPENFSAAGPNCHVPGLHYSHRQETE